MNNLNQVSTTNNPSSYENPANASYFYGRLLREEAEKILKNRSAKNGLFLLRESVQEAGSYALSICYNNEVRHYKIDRQEDCSVKIEKGRKFIGPIELIRHHQTSQDGLITKPTIPCDRPRGTQPIYYLFVNDSEFNKLVEDEIKNQLAPLKEKMSARQYNQELNEARNRLRYKYERIVLKDLHNTQPWFKNNMDRKEVNDVLTASGLLNGKFLVRSSGDNRNSTSFNDLFKISLCYNGEIKHYIIKYNEASAGSGRFKLDGGIEFDSIIQLVDYYHRSADGLADILRIPLLKIPNCAEWISADQSSNKTNNMNNRISSIINDKTDIYTSRKMYVAIMNNIEIQNPPDYLDDEPQNSNDITDLTKVPEPKRALFRDEDSYAYDSLSGYTIDNRDLILYDILGSGCFGSVYRGTYKVKGKNGRVENEIPVAIKHLNTESDSDENRNLIIEEANIMRSLKNPHIIKFIGMCFDPSGKLMIILELAKLGPLHKYLRAHKEDMSMVKIVKLCYQVALAMEYLASRNLVHRDLAARNVLLVGEDFAKVSDFGMSRKMDESLYYTTQNHGKWPLKWYPPEATTSGRFDEKSDVWSFGVTCWEATSFGGRPYQGIDISLLLLKLENGHRLEKPPACPIELFNLMYKCWHSNKHKRPKFTEIVKELKSIIYELYQLNV